MNDRPSAGGGPRPGRPRFPDGYGFTPETPHEPPAWPEVAERLARSRNYWICTASPGGRPHAMPVWGVWHAGALYFVTKRASKKARNLAVNPPVVVHLESGDDVVVLEGRAAELTETVRFREVAGAYAAKYQGDRILPALEVVFEVRPAAVFAWFERDFHRSATKWTFDPPAS